MDSSIFFPVEPFLIALLFVAALTVAAGRRKSKPALVLAALASFSIAWTAHSLREVPIPEEEVQERPAAVPVDQYVTSDSCESCHPEQYATWRRSYHPSMTQTASVESVQGAFDGVQLERRGRRYIPQQDEDGFWAEFEVPAGPEGAMQWVRVPIVMTTGSHHMQIYWYPTGDRRTLGQFDFAWLGGDDQRWVPRESLFLQPPRSADWAETGRWNMTCIKCHTTNARPELEDMDSHASEFGIACEACHGPGEEHVRFNRDPRRRYGLHLAGEEGPSDDTMVNPETLTKERSGEVCGSCHGITFPVQEEMQTAMRSGDRYLPGEPLQDVRVVNQPSEGTEEVDHILEHDSLYIERSFWGDGTVRVSGREYNGLIESPCFQRGEMTCLTCHEMHQDPNDPRPAKEWADDQMKPDFEHGNAACLQCHESLADESALTAHTYHEADSSGSECYNCHMGFTTYGLLKAMRSHTIATPSVSESTELGRPNACNQCHLDKTLGWTAEHLANWYGIESPPLTAEQQAVPASLIWMLSGDAGQRALMAWSMGWDDAQEASGKYWMTPFLSQLLMDPYDAVRYIAGRSLREMPGYENWNYDFVAAPDARRAAAREAMMLSRSITIPEGALVNAAQLLDDPSGEVGGEIFADLLKRRDDRFVELAE